MQKALFPLFCFCLFTLHVPAQKTVPPAATPQQAITYFFDALSALDDTEMLNYITADFLLLEDGAVWNADSLTVHMAPFKGSNFTRKNSFHFFRTEGKAGEAIVAYHNRADITFNNNPIVIEWMESAHLVRQGKGWRIKMLHSTALKPKNK